MRRRLALRAEVLAGRDEAGAEVGLPDAVDERARGRRRLADRRATARTSGASAARSAGSGCRNAGTPGSIGLAGLQEVAALEQARRRASRSRASRTSCDVAGSGCCLPERLDLVVGLLPLGDGRAPVAEDGVDLRGRALLARGSPGSRARACGSGSATGVRRRRVRRGGSGRGCCSSGRRCSSRRGSASAGRSAACPSRSAIGVSSVKTALRGALRRPGPASMPQAVSSLPSIAKPTGPVTRFLPDLSSKFGSSGVSAASPKSARGLRELHARGLGRAVRGRGLDAGTRSARTCP